MNQAAFPFNFSLKQAFWLVACVGVWGEVRMGVLGLGKSIILNKRMFAGRFI